MAYVAFLIGFPLVVALGNALAPTEAARRMVSVAGGVAVFAGSLLTAGLWYFSDTDFSFPLSWVDTAGYVRIGAAAAISLAAVIVCVRQKHMLTALFSLLLGAGLVLADIIASDEVSRSVQFSLSGLSVIMIMLFGFLVLFISIWGGSSLRIHIRETNVFLFLLISSGYGVVLSNDLLWFCVFWLFMGLCLFLLAGISATEESGAHALRVLQMNLISTLLLVAASLLLVKGAGLVRFSYLADTFETAQSEDLGYTTFTAASIFFVTAALIRAAQMPFAGWLIRIGKLPKPIPAAMCACVAVHTGPFLLIRIAPLLGSGSIIDISPGFLVLFMGGLSFLAGAWNMLQEEETLGALNWSTVSYMGMACVCAGIPSGDGTRAAILILVFHALSKMLLLLVTESVRKRIKTRKIDEMEGLMHRMPVLGTITAFGICAVFLFPFGTAAATFAGLEASLSSAGVWTVLMICFGTGAVLFGWTQWLGKLFGVSSRPVLAKVNRGEMFSLTALTCLTLGLALLFPLVNNKIIVPFVESFYGASDFAADALLTNTDMIIIECAAAVCVLMPLLFYGHSRRRVVPAYLSGVGGSKDGMFITRGGEERRVRLARNDLSLIIPAGRVTRIANAAGLVLLGLHLCYALAFAVWALTYLGILGGYA
jgi:ech hydrogenase subunit A